MMFFALGVFCETELKQYNKNPLSCFHYIKVMFFALEVVCQNIIFYTLHEHKIL